MSTCWVTVHTVTKVTRSMKVSVPVFWLLFDPRRIPRSVCQSRQPVRCDSNQACLYLLLIGRLVNLQLLSGRGGGVSLAACRRTVAKLLLLHDLDVGYRRCTNRTNCVKLSAVTGMTYRELKKKWSRPVRPISPEGPGEAYKISVTL